MKQRFLRLIVALLAVLTLLSATVCANADFKINGTGSTTLNFVYGGSVSIPASFAAVDRDHSDSYDGFYYDYHDASQDMEIMAAESPEDAYPYPASKLVDNMYSSYKLSLPKPTYDAKEKDFFELSGYDGSSIYYIRCKKANKAFYTLWFYYPIRNREVCDPRVENICASFATAAAPGPHDLDAIHSDAKYPNYSWMYLDAYEYATVTTDAYCFKDPDTDVWREGNVFTVKVGTELTILAKGGDNYACVILNDSQRSGWMNMKYMSFYTAESSQSASSDSGTVKVTCPYCNGRKVCRYCYGSGGRYNLAKNGEWEPCFFCAGIGLCDRCAGQGYIWQYG